MHPQVEGYNTAYTVKVPLWPYLVAPLSCIGVLGFAALVHHFYTQSVQSAGWTGFTLAFLGLLLVAFTAVAARPRGLVMQVMATGNAMLGLVWAAPAILNGPWSPAMLGLWLAGTVFVTLTAAVYRIMRQARGQDGGSVVNGELGEMFDAVKSLKSVGRFGKPQVDGARVSQAIEMLPGVPFRDLAGEKAQLASLLDVTETAIRTPKDMDSARRGEVVVVPVDQLKDPIPDPGPSAPGGSMADPIILGRAEDGERAEIILPGDPKVHRNAVGLMGVVGMSGSGKTELLLRFCEEVVTRADGDLIIGDARKAGQLPAWLKRAAKSMHDGREVVLELLDDLEVRVSQRSEWLGSRGFKQWVRGCGLQFETYVIFEANAILTDSNIVDLAESVRSVGICVILESQRATWDRFPTSARSNVTTWVCLGVQREDDCEAALSEATVAAGAAPWEWKNKRPGYFYLEWSGRDESLWAAPNRSFIQDETERAEVVAQALGWADDAPLVVGYTPPAGEPEPDGDGPTTAEPDEPAERPGVDPDDPPPNTDPSKPIVVPPGMPDDPFDEAGAAVMSPADALQYLRSHVYSRYEAGVRQLRPQELSGVVAATGRGPWWVYKALEKLSEGPDACLRKTDRGYYKIRPSELVGAGQG